jgi:hypothetical protein
MIFANPYVVSESTAGRAPAKFTGTLFNKNSCVETIGEAGALMG